MLQLTITYIVHWQIILMDPQLNNGANVREIFSSWLS